MVPWPCPFLKLCSKMALMLLPETGGSRTAAASKMERFVIIFNRIQLLHLGCCSSPRSASGKAATKFPVIFDRNLIVSTSSVKISWQKVKYFSFFSRVKINCHLDRV